jgi:SAM-dependent methyltransferase
MSAERAALFEGRGPLTILDAGCGRAELRDFFVAHGHTYVGVDIRPTGDVSGDCESLPFRDQAFDAVLTMATLQYVPHPDRALAELHRVLGNKGTITGTVAFMEPWVWGSLVHLTPGGVMFLLTEAGFTVEHIWPVWHVHGCGRCGDERGRQQTRGVPRPKLREVHEFATAHAGSLGRGGAPLEFAAAVNFHAHRA